MICEQLEEAGDNGRKLLNLKAHGAVRLLPGLWFWKLSGNSVQRNACH